MPSTPSNLRMPPAHRKKQPSVAEIFHTPDPTPQIFTENPPLGLGTRAEDDFVSTRAAVMAGSDNILQDLAIAQQNLASLDPSNAAGYIGGLNAKAFNTMTFNAVDKYSTEGNIDAGVAHVEEIREEAKEPDEIRKLAYAAPKYLDQYAEYSVPREVARRNYFALVMLKYMEKNNLATDTWQQKTKAALGVAIPGRQMMQFGLSKFDLEQSVINMHALPDAEFFKQLPDVMDSVKELSGGNPFYFTERMQTYLDPDDIGWLKGWLALDVVDAAAIAKGIVKLTKLTNLVRAQNTPIKLLRDTGNVEKAAEISVAASTDSNAAQAARTSRADAMQNSSPFGGEGLDPDITNGLAAETQAIVANRVNEVKNIFKPMHDQSYLLRQAMLKPEEVAAAQEKYLSKFAGKATITEHGLDGFTAQVEIQRPGIFPNPATIEKQLLELRDTKTALKQMLKDAKANPSQRGAQAKLFKESIDTTRDEINRYEMILERINRDPKNARVPEVQTVEVKYRNNDFGELEAIEYEKAIRFVNSPSTYIDQMLPGAVEHATEVDYQTARVVNQLMKARSATVSGLDKKSRKLVDAVMMQGDKDQVVWSNDDLINGVRTPEGFIKLETAEQLGAYRASREVFDQLWELKNKEIVRDLELGNFKTVTLQDGTFNFVNPNKIIKNEEIARIKRIYNANTGLIEDVERINPQDVLNQRIFELKYPLENAEGEIVNYIVMRESSLKEIPRFPLAKRNGYVPKIDKNIFWVAEMIGDKLVNGVMKPGYRTVVRYFDNPVDAKLWSQTQTAKGQVVSVRSGREWLDSAPGHLEEFEAQIFGGLYGGKRAQAPVPFGLEGTEAERVGGFEAMEAYMNHIALRMPAVDFRSGLIQRFLNSAHDPLTGESYLANPGDWRSELINIQDKKQRDGLTAMRDWIQDQVRIPTTEERVWGNMAQSIANGVSRVPGAGRTLSKWAMQAGARDAFAQMRGLSFHATLGWLNASQFFVQAMGASLAASMNPLKAPISLGKSLALRAAMFSDNPEVWARIAKASALDTDRFAAMMKAYRKSGLWESTLSTGDYASVQGMPWGPEGLRFLADKSLVFFKEGERWARNYAWVQAFDEVIPVGVQTLTDAQISAVTNLHFKYTLNLNRANRAFWQKGALSIPTQFFQISTKFIENMMPNILLKNPNGWTGKEKAFVTLGQVALFGAAGVPFGSTLTSSLLNWAQSKDDFGLAVTDPAMLTALQGGLSELSLYNWTGERMSVANRLSIPAGIQQMVEILSDDNRTVGDVMLGVTGSVGARVYDAIKMNTLILASVAHSGKYDKEAVWEVLDETAAIVSSWRNYRKARIWAQMGYASDRGGNRIFPVNATDDRALLWAQGIGIAPKQLEEYYRIKGFNKATEDDYKDAVTGVIAFMNRYYNDKDMLTNPEKQMRVAAGIDVMMWGFTNAERLEIMRRVDKKRAADGYRLPEEMEKALDNMYNKEGAADLQLNATMVDK